MPCAADALAKAQSCLLGIGTALYEKSDMPHGYFSSPEAIEQLQEMLIALENDLRHGSYMTSIDATRQLCSAAVQKGVRIIECYQFWQLLERAIRTAVNVRESASIDSDSRVLDVLMLCLKYNFLDEIDNPSQSAGS